MSFYLLTLGLTLLIELPLVWLLTRRRCGNAMLLPALLANLVSHPLATLAVSDHLLPWIVAEALVVVFEGLVYHLVGRLGLVRALLIAFVTNLLTAALSFVF